MMLLLPLNNQLMGQLSLKCTFLPLLGMSVTTQGGSGQQCVTGPRRNISKYSFVLLNGYRFLGDLRHNKPQASYFVFAYLSTTLI